MAYDGKLLAKARNELDNIRAENQAEQQRRRSQIYFRIPEIHEIDIAMQKHMAQVLRLTFSRRDDIKEQIDALKDENLALQARKAELLSVHGYPADYMADIYSCPKCRDTGTFNNGVCSCLQALYNKELTKDLAVLMRNGSESFDRFDLSLYSDKVDPRSGVIPREIMRLVFTVCRMFADSFPNVSSNLMLWGGTGLGKTYLSACIARAVSEKGHSVCYDTASAALDAFEKQKFSKDIEESEAAAARVKRMLGCDLMILDDLGTEMVTPMSLSALYTLVNTRLVNGRPTIISTNLSPDELPQKYTAQIASRILGEYRPLRFVGSDIRLIKK